MHRRTLLSLLGITYPTTQKPHAPNTPLSRHFPLFRTKETLLASHTPCAPANAPNPTTPLLPHCSACFSETNNDLNREFAKAGDPGQYANIVVQHELGCVTMSHMKSFAAIPRGQGQSDWVNALLVRSAR